MSLGAHGITVAPASPRDPEAVALLELSHALMRALFQPEENHFLSIDDLCRPGIRFFTARRGPTAVGTAALADKGDYGEVKSMFVAETARGSGAGRALLDRLEAEARAMGLASLKLETGTGLDAAMRLYEASGFTYRGPFGDYADNGTSIFMEKPLAP